MTASSKFLFVTICALSSALFAQEGEVVVEHSAPLGTNVIAAKQKAYEVALVKSLLMASESIANPVIWKANVRLLRAKLAENPKSFIQDYQFLEQTTRGNQYFLKLKVDPKWIFLQNKLTDWGFLGFQSKPHIQIEPFLINAKENPNITVSGEYWSSKVAAHLAQMKIQAKAVPASSRGGAHVYTVQAKITRTSKSKVEFALLLSNTKLANKQQVKVSIKRNVNEDMMAGLLGLALIENIMPAWFESKGNQRVYEVRLQNVTHYQLQQEFKKVMQSQRGIVQSIQDKTYLRGATVFQVYVLQEDMDLPKFLSTLKVSGKSVRVIEQAGQGRTIAIELQ